MRYYPLSLAVTFACVFALGAGADSQDLSSDYSTMGPVYVDGVRLTPPYLFTGVGSDTLCLNGIPYATYGPPPVESSPDLLPEAVHARFAFEDSAASVIMQAAPSDRLASLASIYRDSPLVLEVQERESWLQVRWVRDPEEWETVSVPVEDVDPPDVAALQQARMKRFYATVESGGLIAFGTRYRRHYHISAPADMIPRVFQVIEKLERGEPLTQTDVASTPLQNPQFVEDLVRVREGRGKE